jgi:signal recognition particle subunit SRP54
MFGRISEGFKNAINKIKLKDDEKSLKKALDELKKNLLKSDVHFKTVKELLKKAEVETKRKGIGKANFLMALEDSLTEILKAPGNFGFVFCQFLILGFIYPEKILMHLNKD